MADEAERAAEIVETVRHDTVNMRATSAEMDERTMAMRLRARAMALRLATLRKRRPSPRPR